MTSGIKDSNHVKKMIGGNIRKMRESRGIERPNFCDLLNQSPYHPVFEKQAEMNPDRLKQWEYGANPVNLEWIPAICEVLNVDVGYLFGEYNEPTRQVSDVVVTTGLSAETVEFLQKNRSVAETISLIDTQQLALFSRRLEQIENAICDAVAIIDGIDDGSVVPRYVSSVCPWISAYKARESIDLAMYKFHEACREIAEFCDIDTVLKKLDNIWIAKYNTDELAKEVHDGEHTEN